jgi:YihY family inner membrane protein
MAPLTELDRVERSTLGLSRRIDAFQQRHAVTAFPVAVAKKFSDDRAGREAALIAYRGLFSLFPLLLLFSTILGIVLDGHPELQQSVLSSALSRFPVIGSQIRENIHALRGDGWTLVFGIVATIWGGIGVGQAVESAMNTVWNVPMKDRPSFLARRVRAALSLAVLGLAAVISTFLVGYVTSGISRTVWMGVVALALSAAVNLGVFLASFRILTAHDLTWRDVLPGAIAATIGWQTLQALGGWYVGRRLESATEIYGFFAIVIGLLAFMSLASLVLLAAAEVNVVRNRRLWPRALVHPPLTASDRAVYRLLATAEERRPEAHVRVVFDEDPAVARNDNETATSR